MRRTKLVFYVGGFLFNGRLLRRRTIVFFPLLPRVLGDFKFPPLLLGSRELLHTEHHIRHNNDKCCIGDWVFHLFYLGLRISDLVYVLRDALAIEMISLHFVF